MLTHAQIIHHNVALDTLIASDTLKIARTTIFQPLFAIQTELIPVFGVQVEGKSSMEQQNLICSIGNRELSG